LPSHTDLKGRIEKKSNDLAIQDVLRQAGKILTLPERPPLPPLKSSIQAELFLRFLFSALVDADYLDTEAHFDSGRSRLRYRSVDLEILAESFWKEQDKLSGHDQSPVNLARHEIYQACVAAAEYDCPREAWSWERVAQEMAAEPQCLTVVNTKKDALALLDALNDPEVLHLSTLLCMAQRREVMEEIKKRLDPERPLPCRVVATQVVEAGVDLDFPVVLRALGPLDRIVQAAGRCNREGRLSMGRVIIFQPAEVRVPPGGKARRLLRRLQPYLVNVRRNALARYQQQGLVRELPLGLWEWQGNYHPVKGLHDAALDPESLVI